MVLALAFVETLVVHLVAVAYWGWPVAIALGVLDLSLLAYLVGLLVSFRRLPVLLEGDRLTLRVGRKAAVTLRTADIAGFRTHWTGADLKRPEVANMAIAAWPNVLVDLNGPVPGKRGPIRAIAHKLDDPVAFRTAVERTMVDHPRPAASLPRA